MGGGLFAYSTSASPGRASWTAAQQTLLSWRPGIVAAVVAVAADSDGEAAAEPEAEPAAGGLPRLAGQPRQLRQGPEEVALSGSRSGKQPGLRGSEPAVSVRCARCEAMRVAGWRPGLLPPPPHTRRASDSPVPEETPGPLGAGPWRGSGKGGWWRVSGE